MKRYIAFIIISVVILLSGCGVSLTADPVQNYNSAAASTDIPRAADSPLPFKSSFSGIKLYMYADGKCVRECLVTDETKKNIVREAVFNYLIRSAAWPAVDLDELSEYIEIHYKVEEGEGLPSVYYAFIKEGKPCIQGGERYSFIDEDCYAPLYELVSGNPDL